MRSQTLKRLVSLLLCLCGQVHAFSHAVRGGGWDDAVTMSHTTRPMVELAGKKLGILGYGHIGAKMAGFGQALGMEVLVYSRTKKEAPGCRWVSLEELFAEVCRAEFTATTQRLLTELLTTDHDEGA